MVVPAPPDDFDVVVLCRVPLVWRVPEPPFLRRDAEPLSGTHLNPYRLNVDLGRRTGAEATVHAHGAAPEQLLVGGARAFHLDQFLDGASGEMAAVVAAVAKADATVFSEAHSDATLPHALHGLDGTVAKHAYRQPVWLADAP